MSQNLNPNDAISGIFIEFSTKERDVIYAMLEEEGYTPDGEGVKKFLLDECEGEEGQDEDFDIRDVKETATDRVLDKVQEYVNEHPEMVAQAKSLIGNIGTAISNRIKKGREPKGEPGQ